MTGAPPSFAAQLSPQLALRIVEPEVLAPEPEVEAFEPEPFEPVVEAAPVSRKEQILTMIAERWSGSDRELERRQLRDHLRGLRRRAAGQPRCAGRRG